MLKNEVLPIRLTTLFFVAMATWFLSACDNNRHVHDLQRYVAEEKQKSMTQIKPHKSGVITLPASVSYQPSITHTPFQAKVSLHSEKGRVVAPLNAYPLSVLRLIGTLEQRNQIWGIIVTPDNKVYQVKQGDSIGDQYGRITTITADHLEVTEQVNEEGRPSAQRIVTLQLKDES